MTKKRYGSYVVPPDGIKIHLGCGFRRLDGFVHVDVRAEYEPDKIGTAQKLPFEDDTAELIYWSHGLEHIHKNEVPRVVSELRRVLRPGGTLRLSMPDFDTLVTLYLDGVSLTRLGCINGGQDNEHDVHFAVYDFEHLACMLHGDFYDIRTWAPHQVHPTDFDDFSRARINGVLISLNVEATCK